MAVARRWQRDFGELLELYAITEDEDLETVMELMLHEEIGFSTGPRINLDQLNDEDVLTMFRFERNDILTLHDLLRMPEYFHGYNRTKSTGLEALLLLLRRLAYPNRLIDLNKLSGRSPPELSIIINMALDHIYEAFGHLVTDMDQPFFAMENLLEYCAAIRDKGAPLNNCYGFIDGTVRPVSRPSQDQRNYFSGHKRVHAIKFQSIMLPNGIIGNMYGPIHGSRHDSYMLAESNILPYIEEHMNYHGNPLSLYGDPAYPLRPHLLAPFRNAANEEQTLFNQRMSSVRESVEWGFGQIVQNWAYLDFKKNLKILLQPVQKYYKVGTLLTNCQTCLYGNIVSKFFDCNPPAINEYLVPANQ